MRKERKVIEDEQLHSQKLTKQDREREALEIKRLEQLEYEKQRLRRVVAEEDELLRQTKKIEEEEA